MNFKKYGDKILVFFVLVLFLLVFLFKGGFNNYSENILTDGNDKDMNFFIQMIVRIKIKILRIMILT